LTAESRMPAVKLSELDKLRPIHLTGVAGSGMNGLAVILRSLGFIVRGTDPRADSVRARLEALDIRVFQEQDGSRVAEDTSLMVISQAISQSHQEVIAARALGIPVITYPKCVGALMAERLGAAVAGTHGKTTVTSMIVSILRAAGIDPGFVIGGFIPKLGAGSAAGSGNIFVAEACEFNRSFLELSPKVAVITNIEADHLDVYKDLEEIKTAFHDFALRVQEQDGVLIVSASCPNTPSAIRGLKLPIRTFGLNTQGVESADYLARNIVEDTTGSRFDLFFQDAGFSRFSLKLFGSHNIANAAAATAACVELGVSADIAADCLSTFEGARRRFEIVGEKKGITVVDDYAHHPTAVRLLIKAARTRFSGRRIVIAFQPHQYSRTRAMLGEFALSLSGADEVVIPNIYFARDTEEDVRLLRPEALSEAISALGTPAVYIGDLTSTASYLIETLKEGDVLILAGAGDIGSIAGTIIGTPTRDPP
jgi:UDP-N-acetylmuramate--alanine ligase